MKYQHFIITLFNLKIWGEDKHNQPTQTAEWLDRRFALFEQYCLPSVKQQSVQNFTWLCLLDTETPVQYKERMARYEQEFPLLKTCYFSAGEASTFRIDDLSRRCRFIRDKVASLLDDGTDYVITTNVDNDDSLHCDMVAALQRHFQDNPRETMYSMNLGLQYFPEMKAVMKMRYPHNHFLTLAEQADKDFHTIEFYRHAEARKQFYTQDIFEQPYWMEVVHSCNVSNDLRITSRIGYTPPMGRVSLSAYGLPVVLSASRNLRNFLWTLPVYFAKTAVRKLRKKI